MTDETDGPFPGLTPTYPSYEPSDRRTQTTSSSGDNFFESLGVSQALKNKKRERKDLILQVTIELVKAQMGNATTDMPIDMLDAEAFVQKATEMINAIYGKEL